MVNFMSLVDSVSQSKSVWLKIVRWNEQERFLLISNLVRVQHCLKRKNRSISALVVIPKTLVKNIQGSQVEARFLEHSFDNLNYMKYMYCIWQNRWSELVLHFCLACCWCYINYVVLNGIEKTRFSSLNRSQSAYKLQRNSIVQLWTLSYQSN